MRKVEESGKRSAFAFEFDVVAVIEIDEENEVQEMNNIYLKTKVTKVELHNKKFLGKPVKALKIFADNQKDLHKIANCLPDKEIDKRREYDINYTTRYVIEKNLVPLIWYKITGEPDYDLNIDADICIRVDKIEKSKTQKQFNPKVLAYYLETDEFEIGKEEEYNDLFK